MSATAAILITAGAAAAASYLISTSRSVRFDPVDPEAERRLIEEQVMERPRLRNWLGGNETAGRKIISLGLVVVFGLTLFAGWLFDSLDEQWGFARFDSAVAEWGAQNKTDTSTTLMSIFTELGGTVPVVIAAAVAAWFGWRKRRSLQVVYFLLSVTVGQALINLGLKALIDRERPDIDQLAPWAGSSFPSGHSAAAAATWAAIALVMSMDRSRTAKAIYAALAALIAAAVGATRALLGVHWLTDVMAGLSVGWIWFTICAVAFGGYRMRFGSLFTRSVNRATVTPTPAFVLPTWPTVRRFATGWLGRYLALVAVTYLAGLVVTRLLADTGVGTTERSLSTWFAEERTAFYNQLTDIGSAFSDTVTIVIALLLVIGALAMKFRRWIEPAFITAAVTLETAVFATAAFLVGRDRPPVEQLDVSPPTASFPSGHTAAAVAFYGGLAVLVWMYNRNRVARYAAAAGAVLIPLFVAVSRLYRGMHYLTDVIAGLLLGIASVYLTVQLFRAVRRARADEPDGLDVAEVSSATGLDAPEPATLELEPNKSFAVVANPAGSPLEIEQMRRLLDRSGLSPDWYDTTPDDPGTGQARSALEQGADVVVALGGDGTVRAVIDALAGSDRVLGIVPSGTGNLLASNLQIPDDVADATGVAVGEEHTVIDLGQVDGESFAVMAGVGFDARIMRDTGREAKERFGMLAYVAEGLRHLRDRPFGTLVSVDGEPWYQGEASMILVGNMSSIRNGIEIFPDSSPHDGELDVLVVRASGWWEWLKAGLTMLTGRTNGSRVTFAKGSLIEVALSEPVPHEIDGEEREAVSGLEFTCRPQALRVAVPAQADAPQPSDELDAGRPIATIQAPQTVGAGA